LLDKKFHRKQNYNTYKDYDCPVDGCDSKALPGRKYWASHIAANEPIGFKIFLMVLGSGFLVTVVVGLIGFGACFF